MPFPFRLLLSAALAVVMTGAGCDAQTPPRPAAAPAVQKQVAKQPLLFRHASIEAAWKAAQKSRRPMMVYVTSKQCHFCDKMLKETWSHPQIAQAVAQRFEPVALLKENNEKLMKELGVRAYPTTILVSPKGELAGHLRGFANPQKFAAAFLLPPQKDRLIVQPASHAQQRQR